MPRINETPTPDKYFYLRNGGVIKNAHELKDTLPNMEDELYGHHVTNDRNDFATWVKDVFDDHILAAKIRKAKTRHHAARQIRKKLTPKQSVRLKSKEKLIFKQDERKPVPKKIVIPAKPSRIEKIIIDDVKNPKVKVVRAKKKTIKRKTAKTKPKRKTTKKKKLTKRKTKRKTTRTKPKKKTTKKKATSKKSKNFLSGINSTLRDVLKLEKEIEREENSIQAKLATRYFNHEFNKGLFTGVVTTLVIVLLVAGF